MIRKISIKGFKSIKEAGLDTARINVFIGEPNSGKTNIIECVGLLSLCYAKKVENIVRFEDFSNLFYDNYIKKDAVIKFDFVNENQLSVYERNREAELVISNIESHASISYNNILFPENQFKIIYKNNKTEVFEKLSQKIKDFFDNLIKDNSQNSYSKKQPSTKVVLKKILATATVIPEKQEIIPVFVKPKKPVPKTFIKPKK